jgi:23S rRNA pseudouridine2605 synthase
MTKPMPEGERLQKVLARAGIASRRAAEDLILAGRVQVNGQMVTELGTRVDPAHDRIVVDGQAVPMPGAPAAEERVTYLLHKPLGVVSTASDPEGRPTVVSLVPAVPRVYPVGRLDADTEGLLLLSNDGDLAFRLTHPRYGVDKEYEVLVRGVLPADSLRKLREGVLLEGETRPTAPAQIAVIKKEDGNTLLRFVIHEGRKRQIRRMVAAIGGHVNRLRRVRFGALTLGDLAPGQWRRLTPGEIHTLDQATGGPAVADSAHPAKGAQRGAARATAAPDHSERGPRRGGAAAAAPGRPDKDT